MGFLILIVIACVVWVLCKVLMNADADSQPSTPARQHQSNEQYVKQTFIPGSGVSRMEFLNRYGWEDTPRKYFIAFHPFTLDVLAGYGKFPFIGTQYREDVTIEDIGWFNGFAFCDIQNPHDKYAIAIVREDEKVLGYIPRGEMGLWKYIASQGGVVHAYGALSYNPELDKWIGTVAVETNGSATIHRNAYVLKPNLTFYESNPDYIKFIKEHQSEE